eukprot:gnl/MRDRNA2_/MRDRNA2_63073_c0_seq1.p2 gnl/MRDRNA2_/MRDRNA2_63073_c0~~gnl/MRDRNA2_/MRDRNA2_63073_c0_seq1.p2  ORF type:complete len:160 (-),score=18.73 gnl/MRDRNA2_/MRDRNA2_63073_c0_seq1:280-759(-)
MSVHIGDKHTVPQGCQPTRFSESKYESETHKGDVEVHEQELLVVAEADAIANPWAEVIHAKHTSSKRLAVMSTLWAPHHTLATEGRAAWHPTSWSFISLLQQSSIRAAQCPSGPLCTLVGSWISERCCKVAPECKDEENIEDYHSSDVGTGNEVIHKPV